MTIEVVVRRPQSSEYNSVRALIATVANETFKDLFAPNPVPLEFKDQDWPLAWVAVSDEKIVGVIITNQEWVSDLWVLREHRRQTVGSRLLAQGEAEIAARGHQTCRLRVVRSNVVAVRFYLSQGWQIAREFAHEKYHHAMLGWLTIRNCHPCQRPILIFELKGDGIRSKKIRKCFIRHCLYQSPYRVVLAALRSPHNHFSGHPRISVERRWLAP